MKRITTGMLCAGLTLALGLAGYSQQVQGGTTEEGPRKVVTEYMEALKGSDYGTALNIVGLPLPAELSGLLKDAVKSAEPSFKWVVKAYQIKEVKLDGGLAEVTVDETSAREINPKLQTSLTESGLFGKGLQTGELKTTETFVLVRLQGRWRFDPSFSGIAFDKFPVADVLQATKSGKPVSAETQKKLGDFVNTVGVGQMLPTLNGPTIIPMMAAFLVPKFEHARAAGQLVACKSNLKNIGTAAEMYSTDNSGRYPTKLSQLTPNYLRSIPTCPSAGKDTYSASYKSAVSPDGFTVACGGSHHTKDGLGPNLPKYTSLQGLLTR